MVSQIIVYFTCSPIIRGKKIKCVYVTDNYANADEVVRVTKNPNESDVWWYKTSDPKTADAWVKTSYVQ